jgi:sec-independent protein translocase protein TatA
MNFPLAFIQNLGWMELLVIGAIILLVFGPRRLPEIAEAFGKSIRKFKSATNEVTDEVKREINSEKSEDE